MSAWEIRFSKSRQLPYFYDSASGTSTWERPEALSEEQITSLQGAHYLQQHANGSGNGNVPEGQVRASHLLVKHRDSRRPSSWKEVSLTKGKILLVFVIVVPSNYSHHYNSYSLLEKYHKIYRRGRRNFT